ncbi:Hypothetical protein MVR_LOCUS23 [uncultured virus]|nr:Hypothetical protein MVR_LOCUS23 [uncultured virus]
MVLSHANHSQVSYAHAGWVAMIRIKGVCDPESGIWKSDKLDALIQSDAVKLKSGIGQKDGPTKLVVVMIVMV